jgi:hypothetical protein
MTCIEALVCDIIISDTKVSKGVINFILAHGLHTFGWLKYFVFGSKEQGLYWSPSVYLPFCLYPTYREIGISIWKFNMRARASVQTHCMVSFERLKYFVSEPRKRALYWSPSASVSCASNKHTQVICVSDWTFSMWARALVPPLCIVSFWQAETFVSTVSEIKRF